MPGLLDHHIIFFGGKGGVGKTTCAAAVALAASRLGRRVLLVSTDPAHSTSDALGIAIPSTEALVAPGLTAMEIDPVAEAREYIADVKARATALFGEGATKAMAQIDLAGAMPGIEDAALFDRLSRLVADRADHFDLVVFDTAPTGHTLPLLRMPDAMGTWLHALAASRRAMLPEDRLDADPIIATLEERITRLRLFHDRLTGPAAAFVFVLIPEKLPIDETARALEQLQAAGVAVAGLIVNQVIPESATGAFIEARREQERAHLARIDRLFAQYSRVRVPRRPADVHGLEDLAAVAGAVLG
ncbi:MAG: ArsA family ATPase [Vicinamibacterales bacterium]